MHNYDHLVELLRKSQQEEKQDLSNAPTPQEAEQQIDGEVDGVRNTLAENNQIVRDQIRMMNPDIQGPRQPSLFDQALPAQRQLAQDALTSVATGSITSGPKKAQAIADAIRNMEQRPVQTYSKQKLQELRNLAQEIKDRETIPQETKLKVFRQLSDYLRKARIRGIE